VLAAPTLLPELVAATLDEDRIVRRRAADAVEKVSRVRPELLAPHVETVLERLTARPEPELRWHVAQLLPRLPLTGRQRARALTLLTAYADDPSRIVQTCAMQALVDLTQGDRAARSAVLARVQDMADTGGPAVRSRARRLLRDHADRAGL
jgi:hypothetical protein